MKHIDTLISDIYSLFGKDRIEVSDALLSDFSTELTKLVGIRLGELSDRQPTLRMSNIGKPDRQIWYDINGKHEKEPLLGHTHIKFMYGDLIEQLVIFLAKQAGHTVEFEQKEVELDGIKGHIDCYIDGWLIDVKSASPYSFQKFDTGSLFEAGNDPFGYVGQLSGYAKAEKAENCAFLAVNKVLGTLSLLPVPSEIRGSYDVEQRIKDIREVIKHPEPPRRCYLPKEDGKSGNLILDTGCSYCNHKFECWSDANNGLGLRVFFYYSGPKFFVEVKREPNVPEKGRF